MSPKIKKLLPGILASNIFAIIIIGITKYLTASGSGPNGTFIFSEFIILPMMMGIICAWYWREENYQGWWLLLFTFCDVAAAIGFSYIFMGEGIVCLVIVSPLITLFIYTGALIGRAMFRKDNQRLNISLITLMVALFFIDAFSVHTYQNEVSDNIVVNAPVNKVWQNVVAFKRIKQPATFWLFRIGLPSPTETTVEGYHLGARRKCIFSNGYTFGEVISTFEPGKDLVFDITDQPRDPEIMNHLDLLRGEFVLKDNRDGTTTLTGNSWYKLYVFPAWYYDIWAKTIVRNVHTRVMEHIKKLSENPGLMK